MALMGLPIDKFANKQPSATPLCRLICIMSNPFERLNTDTFTSIFARVVNDNDTTISLAMRRVC